MAGTSIKTIARSRGYAIFATSTDIHHSRMRCSSVLASRNPLGARRKKLIGCFAGLLVAVIHICRRMCPHSTERHCAAELKARDELDRRGVASATSSFGETLSRANWRGINWPSDWKVVLAGKRTCFTFGFAARAKKQAVSAPRKCRPISGSRAAVRRNPEIG